MNVFGNTVEGGRNRVISLLEAKVLEIQKNLLDTTLRVDVLEKNTIKALQEQSQFISTRMDKFDTDLVGFQLYIRNDLNSLVSDIIKLEEKVAGLSVGGDLHKKIDVS